MSLPHAHISPITVTPRVAASPTNMNLRYTEIDENFAYLEGDKAPLASPALTGIPTAPTAAVETNTTQLATTAFVATKIAAMTPAHGAEYFDATGTFIAPHTGVYQVELWGGGAGAYFGDTQTPAEMNYAGASGGFVLGYCQLTAGVAYPVTIGAGGAAGAPAGHGGTSSFLSLTATGGTGFQTSASHPGPPGIGTGGTLNLLGSTSRNTTAYKSQGQIAGGNAPRGGVGGQTANQINGAAPGGGGAAIRLAITNAEGVFQGFQDFIGNGAAGGCLITW